MQRVRARHIQVADGETLNQVIAEWQSGTAFEELVTAYSQCPTARQGGHLGEFGPGQMPPEIDEVVFSGDVGQVYGPVQTAFGFHLIEILPRSE